MSLRDAAVELAAYLQEKGYVAWFAGGCVRDKLLGKEPKDYDIASSATPQQVLEVFPKAKMVGAHFGVALVRHKGYSFEVATFRNDGSYSDSRRPDSVSFSTPEEDSARRDFTINSLFEDPATGEIIDFHQGRADLEAGILRTVGKAQDRFREDALRLLRAIRFAARLDFQIAPDTWSAIQLAAPRLQKISTERIRDEFSAIICDKNRAHGLDLLVESGLIDIFLPEIRSLIGCTQPPQWHPEGDVYTHTRIALNLLPEDAPLSLCLAVLLHDIAKPPTRTIDPDGRIRFNGHDELGAEMAGKILRRLKYPNQIIADASFMVSRHMQFMHVQKMRTSTLKRFVAPSTFSQELELHRVDCASSNGFTDNYDYLQKKIEEFANEPIIPKPLLTGKDLIALGYAPGPLFKKILEALQTEQLEGRLSTSEEAMVWLKQQKTFD